MKTTFLLIMITLLSLPIIAQEKEEETSFFKNTTTFGIKGGLNQSFIDGSGELGGLSIYGGLFAETRLTRRWSLQNAILYSQAKDFRRIQTASESVDGDNTIIQFEVPVHLKYYITDKFSVFGGPKISFLAGGAADDFGISAEIGLQYDISKRFFVETSYSFDVSKQAGRGLSNGFLSVDEVPLGLLRFGVGIKF